MRTERSIPQLFGDVVDQLSTLFRKEVQLVRAETSEKVRQARGAVVSMVIGGVILNTALVALLGAAVVWLTYAGLELRWSILLVGAIAALIGYAFVQKGMSDLKASNLAPSRTMEQLQRDAYAAREQVR